MGSYCSGCGIQNSADSQFCIQCGGSLGSLPVVSQSAVAVSTRYAGFWIRVLAAIIDWILIQVVVLPVSFVVGMFIGAAGIATHSSGVGVQMFSGGVGTVIGLVGGWLYNALMESSPRQGTLGKMIFSMKVTDIHGQRLSFFLPPAAILPKSSRP